MINISNIYQKSIKNTYFFGFVQEACFIISFTQKIGNEIVGTIKQKCAMLQNSQLKQKKKRKNRCIKLIKIVGCVQKGLFTVQGFGQTRPGLYE